MEYKGTHAPLRYGKRRLVLSLRHRHVRSRREVLRRQARVFVRVSVGSLLRRDRVWNGRLLSWVNRQAREYDMARELGHLCPHEHSPRRGRRGNRGDQQAQVFQLYLPWVIHILFLPGYEN